MEWAFDEFASFLSAHGTAPLVHGYTRNYSESTTRNTQVSFTPGAASGIPASLPLTTSLVTTLAIVPCYNEADVITLTIDRLLEQGVDVHVIDNWSDDGSWELLESTYRADPRVSVERYPEESTREYLWPEILEHMDTVASRSPHDWIMHVDADEQLDSFSERLDLKQTLTLVDAAGYDVVDFTLIDFRPEESTADGVLDGAANLLPRRWQFSTRPGARALERAWKNRHGRVGLSDTGGHSLPVDKRVFPLNMVLRHYPLRSPEQARRKIFRDRLPRFERDRRERGWHTQYDGFSADAAFTWPASELHDWSWCTPREWTVELTTRQGFGL
jgi:glycosyltransferase involved in cell wall biosynthesis